MKRCLLALLLVGCAPAVAPKPASVAGSPPPLVDADVLGRTPELALAPVFLPPAPVSMKLTNGSELRLLEVHRVPMVSVTLAISGGAGLDPSGQAGLAYFTAQMLDEGAGKYDGSALAAAFESLGTSLHIEVDADATYLSFTVLKENLSPAVALLSDVVIRPRFAPKDFSRAHGLWIDALKARADDAESVARVVMRKVALEGTLGRPWSGTLADASKVTLADIRAHHRAHFRPGLAAFAVAGDVSSSEMTNLLESQFGKWPVGPEAVGLASLGAKRSPPPRLVVVDRPGAPQAVIGFARFGLAASSPDMPGVMRANVALGGSFTSRLNLDLREKHGWTYGARSSFSVSNNPGMMAAWAAVQTDATIDAAKALLFDVSDFAAKGLTSEEFGKTLATMNAEFVRSYSTIDAMAGRLAQHEMLGRPLDADAQLLKAATSLDSASLNALAKKYFATHEGTLVIVGPLERFKARLTELGLGAPQTRDAEGEIAK